MLKINFKMYIIATIIAIPYIIGFIYYEFIWTLEWWVDVGFFSWLFFGFVWISFKASIWPIVIYFF